MGSVLSCSATPPEMWFNRLAYNSYTNTRTSRIPINTRLDDEDSFVSSPYDPRVHDYDTHENLKRQ